jgi:antitoxin component YwqK of YwqJK toxin-antitoxin module
MITSFPARTVTKAALVAVVVPLLLSCGGGTDHGTTPPIDTTGAAAHADSLRRMAIADSLKDGYHVYKDKAGRPLMEGQMLAGQRQGVWTSYLPNSRVQSRNVYENGVLHGITTVFHENGVLYYTGMQRKGKPFGEWKFYDNKGILAKTAVYDTSGVIIPDKSIPRR